MSTHDGRLRITSPKVFLYHIWTNLIDKRKTPFFIFGLPLKNFFDKRMDLVECRNVSGTNNNNTCLHLCYVHGIL